MKNLGPIACAVFLLGTVSSLCATPIRPDIKKLVSEPAADTIQFAPARAGWNGPETASNTENFSPAAERLSPAATARAARQSLLAAAIPDWRVVLIIVGLIALLRFLRRKPALHTTPAEAPPSNQKPADEWLRPAA